MLVWLCLKFIMLNHSKFFLDKNINLTILFVKKEEKMKNKIFELYKDKSLQEFLTFKEENPEETFVYVLQHPPENINILSASNFGYLVICLPQLSQIVFSTGPFVFKMRKNLQDFRAQDYILCTGDPAVIGLSTAIVSDITTGKFNLLKWDKREFKYYPLSIDLYKKG